MAGSLLVCQQINATKEEIQKITGGSYFSPADLLSPSGPTEEEKELHKALSTSITAADKRASVAKEEASRAQRISVIVGVGSLCIAMGGLYLSWRSTRKVGDGG